MTGREQSNRAALAWPALRRHAYAPLILGLLAVMYGLYGNTQEVATQGHSALFWMIRRWRVADNLSHGWIIPFISLFFLWRRREDFIRAPRERGLVGLLTVVASLGLYWLGVRAQLTRLTLVSLIGLLWGIPAFLFGRATGRILLFPCAYLVFCVPLSFLNNITVPLRIFASGVSTWLLNGLGIETARTGTAVYSSAAGGFSFDVADACSGLRSLLAMTALTAAYAYLTQQTLLRRWLLFPSAVPLAIAGYVTRVLTVAIVAETMGMQVAMRIYHDYSGFLVFIVAVLMMLGLGELIRKVPSRAKAEA